MNKIFTMAAVISLFSLLPLSQAMALNGAELYQSKACASCHGQDAKTPIQSIYPSLAGQNADYAYNQMQDIKSGARANGQSIAMKAIIATVSDEEMRAIADWLATLE